jgi:DNA-binding NarL/FixJ family response regulator
VNDRDPGSAGENAALHGGARIARVVLIEPRTSFRECLARALMTFLPCVSIEGVKSSDEVVPGPAKLVLIGPDLLSGCERWQLSETIRKLRRLSDGAPIGAYLHARDMRVAASLTTLGIVGIVMSDASTEIAVAYLGYMVVGGAFLTPGLVDRHGESIVVASVPAHDLSPQDLSPQAHARPKDSPSPYRNLTARERDVFKSMSAGRTNKKIALDLQISEGTVKVHLHSIMRKLRATNRTQAAVRFGALAAETMGS